MWAEHELPSIRRDSAPEPERWFKAALGRALLAGISGAAGLSASGVRSAFRHAYRRQGHAIPATPTLPGTPMPGTPVPFTPAPAAVPGTPVPLTPVVGGGAATALSGSPVPATPVAEEGPSAAVVAESSGERLYAAAGRPMPEWSLLE